MGCRPLTFAAIALTISLGCDAKDRESVDLSQPNVAPAETTKLDAPQIKFTVTDAARDKLRNVHSRKNATHVVVSSTPAVNCTGFLYGLDVQANPSHDKHAFLESNGLNLAIPLESMNLLNNAKLDYVTQGSG
jgi:Fe-S cluster assembly iron-binding protein IscA